ncbi:hypothetical protein HMPREF1000_03996 [Parabacteroides sp. D26]|nr:hypothetical protein HMPREF1000_03996 [Parabacteroides sp. D26]
MKNKEVDRYVNTKLKKYCNCSVFGFLYFSMNRNWIKSKYRQ